MSSDNRAGREFRRSELSDRLQFLDLRTALARGAEGMIPAPGQLIACSERFGVLISAKENGRCPASSWVFPTNVAAGRGGQPIKARPGSPAVAASHSWVTPTVAPATLPERYEWLHSRPPQPILSTVYGSQERLRSDPPTFFWRACPVFPAESRNRFFLRPPSTV